MKHCKAWQEIQGSIGGGTSLTITELVRNDGPEQKQEPNGKCIIHKHYGVPDVRATHAESDQDRQCKFMKSMEIKNVLYLNCISHLL